MSNSLLTQNSPSVPFLERMATFLLQSYFFRPGSLARRSGSYSRKLWRQWFMTSPRNYLHPEFSRQNPNSYPCWIAQYDLLNDDDRKKITLRMKDLTEGPVFSLLLVCSTSPSKTDLLTLQSIAAQLYKKWELCVAFPASSEKAWTRALKGLTETTTQVKTVLIEETDPKEPHRLFGNLLSKAAGEFCLLLDSGDALAEHALYLFALNLSRHPEAALAYADEDRLDQNCCRKDPRFKPAWSPDLLRSQNYIGRPFVFRTSRARELGGFDFSLGRGFEYDLLLRLTESTGADNIRHIAHVLCHRDREAVTSFSEQALRRSFQRQNVQAKVLPQSPECVRIEYALPSDKPLISIVVGTRDRFDLISNLVNGVQNSNDYQNFELLILDNQSKEPDTLRFFRSIQLDRRIRVLKYDYPFNYSAMNNWGVRHARGEIIGLLNNDLQMTGKKWLSEMVRHALRPEVGAIGAKLLYPDERIQHAGVILGIRELAGHSHKFASRDCPGYMHRLKSVQNLSAVTGACLVLRKSVFDEVGGLDEKNLAVAFNDVDLCLRIRNKGYRILFTPFAELYHLESATRGTDDRPEAIPRFMAEVAYMRSRWAAALVADPYYNPNLTCTAEDFSLAFPPRISYPWKNRTETL